MNIFFNTITDLVGKSGILNIFCGDGWKAVVMLIISGVLIYLAVVREFEPLLLLPIAFGMLLTNLPGGNLFHPELFNTIGPNGAEIPLDYSAILNKGGILDFLYLGVKLDIYPSLIFLGIGAMTDFSPLISNPKSFILGAAAQGGIFFTFIGAAMLPMYSLKEAAGISIIGGADGPTSILVASRLSPELLGSIAIAAYSYMALVPVIQPPIMKALTTKKERAVVMKPLRSVSKTEKILFPIIVALVVILIIPDTAPLIGMLMFGNLLKESGVAKRLVETATNSLMNIVTIFLGVTVGATATASTFLSVSTLGIVALGLIAFCIGTACGVLFGKIMYLFTKGKVNPLIGSAGVSAVPMAARVSQKVGQEANPSNFLLMHAMGPNVSGVIGSAVAAGVLLSVPM